MGGVCSKRSNSMSSEMYTNTYAIAANNTDQKSDLQSSKSQGSEPMSAPKLPEKMERKQQKEEVLSTDVSGKFNEGYSSCEDEFYDGIPRFGKNPLQKLRSRRVKVFEVSSLLGKAGSVGFERAIDALDTLGSSMTSFNPSNGFVHGTTAKNNELSILCFEVANTIAKGSRIMQSLSKRSIKILKEVVLPSEGVQQLVSTNMDELLKIVAADRREQLKIFSGEVVRFGTRCKDCQWHNLDRFFEKHSKAQAPQKQLGDQAELVMQQLMILVQHTADLYQELHRLDNFEEDYQHKCLEESIPNASQSGYSLTVLASELKTQKKLVQILKKKSLWTRSLEEVMEKLVDIVLFLNREISYVFSNADDGSTEEMLVDNQQRLGPAGLSLHYANIILLIDSIVARSSSIPLNARDTLYQSLPPYIKSSLRSKMKSFHVEKEFTVTEIKAEMEKTLYWLVLTATNTAKAHHGSGWVGEWANTKFESNRQSVGPLDVIRIETLHHANRKKTEAYILELLLWLNYLISRSKDGDNGRNAKPSNKSLSCSPITQVDAPIVNKMSMNSSPTLTTEDQKVLQDVKDTKQIRIRSKSQEFDCNRNSSKILGKLNKSHSYSSSTGSNELISLENAQSTINITEFNVSKERKLDIQDRVDAQS